uniref:B-cell scaffold protein with ankyrin repeats n=1 Tax=Amazona collaria TaxID=241587 RepID=A0A8B9IRW3_9PSIT
MVEVGRDIWRPSFRTALLKQGHLDPGPCPENTEDILVIYEQEAEEWALYLKSLFGHIVNEEGILLYNIETSSFKQQELFSLPSFKCKLLILSCGLLNCLNQKRIYFLEQVLRPPDNVVILLCGVENSEMLYETLTLDRGSKEISTDQEPEEYLSVVTGIIQPGNLIITTFNHQGEKSPRKLLLQLPVRYRCGIMRYCHSNPGEIFILLKDEIDDETLEIEFIADNQRIRTQPASWTKKIKYMKALDFPAGPVYVNVYCGGVVKTTAQIEYYTTLEEIEHIFRKVADPIAFTCQVMEKLDDVLTFLLKSKISTYEFSQFQSEGHHQQANSYLEEFPTLLHCAARFGLKNLATLLLDSPEATKACKITNKYGEDPVTIAEKHRHTKLRKLIRELWQILNETMHSLALKAKQNPGDQYGIDSRCQQEAEVGEEKKDDVEDSRETEHEDQEEDLYSFHNRPDNLYASIPDDLTENRRNCFFCKRLPPPPPRNLPVLISFLYCLYGTQVLAFSEGNSVEDRSERQRGDGLITACYKEDTCERDSAGEDLCTFRTLDESVYDFVPVEEEEKRKELKPFIMNRLPAPAPRPVYSPVREENPRYIMQVFQQKATRVPSDSNRTYCDARKPGTEFNVALSLPGCFSVEREELIHLQEQVKKGTTSVDEALDRFKQWQKEKQRLQSSQQLVKFTIVSSPLQLLYIQCMEEIEVHKNRIYKSPHTESLKELHQSSKPKRKAH